MLLFSRVGFMAELYDDNEKRERQSNPGQSKDYDDHSGFSQ